MRRRTRLVLSAACGTLACALAVGYADAARAEAESERAAVLERYGGEVTSLVVSTGRLSAGDVVGEDDVEVRDWLSDLAPEGALSSPDDVVGRRVTSAVAAGSPLSEVDFADAAGAIQVPEGRVAVSVRLSDKTGVTSEVAAGTRLLAYEATGEQTSLLAADVTALGHPQETAARGTAGQTLTVAVGQRDVTRVLAAAAAGTLRLVVPAEDVTGGAVEGDEEADAPEAAPATGEVPATAPAPAPTTGVPPEATEAVPQTQSSGEGAAEGDADSSGAPGGSGADAGDAPAPVPAAAFAGGEGR